MFYWVGSRLISDWRAAETPQRIYSLYTKRIGPVFCSYAVVAYSAKLLMLLLNGWNFKALFDQFISNPLAMMSE